ncbi:MAG: CAP domain-containing protein [Thermoflexales bacterium]|nr:CAP domain-containing protein [Thermoflexales bacterium]
MNEPLEGRLVELINAHRATRRLPPLKLVTPLNETARYHAYDMLNDSYFGTDTQDLLEPSPGTVLVGVICSSIERVSKHYRGGTVAGPSLIARDLSTAEEVLNLWLSNPATRRLIESTSAREIGVGYAEGQSEFEGYMRLWVTDLGARRNVNPIVINREQQQTNQTQVELYIYGRWAQVRLRNDEGEWSNWQAFKNTLSWQISAVPGVRQVCAELRSGSRRETTCDTIQFVGATS